MLCDWNGEMDVLTFSVSRFYLEAPQAPIKVVLGFHLIKEG